MAGSTGSRPTSGRRIVLYSLLLAGTVVSLYAGTLWHGFVFDDVTLIQQNSDVTELNWQRILSRNGYRPVRTLSYALNFAAGGLNPFGYHLFNVFLHAANSVLLFFLLQALLGRLDGSFLGAMLFAVHPVQTAAVAYISGRKDLLAAFFLLLASLFYIRWRRKGGWPGVVLTGLALLLAVLSKEVAVVFPALFVLIDFCGRRQALQVGDRFGLVARLKESRHLYGVLAAAAAAAAYYAIVWTEASRLADHWGGSLSSQWATSFKLFVHYLRLVLLPYPLLADYTGVFPVSEGFLEPATLFCVLISALYGALALWIFRRRPLVTLGMGWFLVSLLPVLQIVGFHEIAADHFLYVPLVGAALVFGYAGVNLASRTGTSILGGALLLAVFVSCSILTVSRNQVWADQVTLWKDTYAKAPESYRANANLGQLYWTGFLANRKSDPGLLKKAVRLLERAAELEPADSLPPSNLGGIYRELGWDEYTKNNLEEAERLEQRALGYLSRAVSLDAEDVWAYSNLGDVRKDLGLIWSRRGNPVQAESERELALEAYRRAIALGSPNPQFPLLYFKLAMVHVDQRDFQKAVPWLEKAVTAPGLAHMWEIPYWMGYCYLATGRAESAIPHLRRSVRVQAHPAGLRLLAYALEGQGGAREAVDLYRQALGSEPDSIETHYLLGAALVNLGQREAARRHLLRARALLEGQPGSISAGHFRRSIRLKLREIEDDGRSVAVPE